ncbi:hypothetical protein ABGB12_22850 [Actinocorallia sp. B10E7]|uniref:hypothetical protein n=1 Tax=Actinocorallia sp. B10E7 TaxID=3153558 RepID=UPI00325D87A3
MRLLERCLAVGAVAALAVGGTVAGTRLMDTDQRVLDATPVAAQIPQRLSALTLASGSVYGGHRIRATVSFTQKAPKRGLKVRVQASGLKVPRNVTVKRGKRSVSFWVRTSAVTGKRIRTVKVSYGQVVRSRRLSVLPLPKLGGLSLAAKEISAGGSVVGTVRLTGPAQPGGSRITLKSSASDVAVPSSVTVPEGSRTASFRASARKEAQARTVKLTARRGKASRTATLILVAAPSVPSHPSDPSHPSQPSGPSEPAQPKATGLLLAPTSIKTGETATGTVTLDRQAGPGGVQVALTVPSGAPYVRIPDSVTVPEGSAEATFTVTGSAPQDDPVRTTTTVAAAAGGATVRTELVVVPSFALRSVVLPVKSYERNGLLPVKVLANGPAPADTHLVIEYLFADGGSGGFPGSLPAGATELDFYVGTPAVTAPEKFVVKVSRGDQTVYGETTVHPALAKVTTDPAPGTIVESRTIKVSITLPEPAETDYPVELNGDSRCYCVDLSAKPVLRAGERRLDFELPATPFSRSFEIFVRVATTDHRLGWEAIWY